MGQFSLKRLFASVTLIAIGVWLFANPPLVAYPVSWAGFFWLTAPIWIGVGLALLSRYPIVFLVLAVCISACQYFWMLLQT